GQHVVDAGVDPRLDGERDALVAVKAGEGRQRAALHLHDRDPEARGMQDESLERLTALRDDEQAMGGPARDERLLDGTPPCHELLVVGQQVGWRDRRTERWRRPRRLPGAIRRRPPEATSIRTGSVEAGALEPAAV